MDIRWSKPVAEEVRRFIIDNDDKSVATADRIIGCPHEEGKEYEGEWCPMCPFWKGRDRFTGKLLNKS